ncbi:PREDICTED: uncharacterized protein LOC103330914 [Prunus mume]|uniref:Uncharacterized protein LOC103330914 n=1 Tax=Prunus mume TaxID=102107 RepID=A0ABM0NYK6_PRUMU|nr:PREDICTED: uncharacterized protein LOC103330914 [Prunus mume]
MIIVSWNVRGVGKVECASTIRDLKKAYGIDVFAVLELRIGGSRALSVAKSLGFSHYHIVDPIGFSGGVWLLWDGNFVSLHVVAHSSQTITALVTMDAKRWLLTVVYASPCSNVRTSLWKYFDGLAAVCNLPWLLLGDFNDIVCGDEKLGGNFDVGGQHFIEWLDRNHLIDLGFSGTNFTWCNKRGEEDIIWKRLDRESMPFRFQAMWLSHPSFFEFLSGLWNSGTGNAFQKPPSLIWPLQRWNKQVFGCLFQKKRRILAWLAGIQRSLCMQFNPFLSQLETDLTTEHNRILDQEEVFWLQKSRNTWLKEGDRNTIFFHLSTIIRSRWNKLEGLTNDAGEWISEKGGMKQIVIHYFQGLFSEPTLSGEYSLLPQYFPELEHSVCTRLNGEVSNVEIQSSLFAIGGLKTPGPDGASLPEHLNDTLIALVPKVERPLNMAQLRPISLCNTLYKVVSKILVSRLRPIMSKIVRPTQVSFVPGRHIVDNIVIAQEMLHKFKVAKGQKGFIAWKIDLSTPYDRLSWSFIKEASIEQCLDDFCSLSGQKVSFEKSMVCVSPNACPGLAQNIASISGSPLSDNLVTSAIPIYSMQTAMLPASVCSKLDQLNKNFLWGHAFDKVKVHLVNWETVCKSTCVGGLGVKKAAWMNQALLAKSGWRLLHNDKGLWAKVLKAKYLKNCDMLSVNEHKFRNCSSSRRGVLFGAKLLPSDVKWRVGSGDSILFWTDVWLSCGALINYALIDLSEEMLQLNVSDFLEEGLWDIACLQECLPPNIVFMITSIHAGFIDSGPDMCIWRFTSNGKFSVKYAYQFFCPVEAGSNWHWGFIWRLQLPPKGALSQKAPY